MRLRPALGAIGAALLLSGCQGLHPGAAVEVADKTISSEQVAAGADALCRASAEQLEAQGQVVGMRMVNQQVVQLLTLRSIADQVAAEYDVTPAAQYEQARTSAREELSGLGALDEEGRALMLDLATAQTYVSSVVTAVGRELLAQEGRQDVSRQAAGQRGGEAFAQWGGEHRIEVDPRYGLSWKDGQLAPEEGDTSFPVSDLAAAAAEDTPGSEHVADLPASQRCGSPDNAGGTGGAGGVGGAGGAGGS